jgi:hypothetical protein
MRGVYRTNVQATGLTAGRTVIYITAPANRVVEILSASVTPIGTNVTNQNLECAFQRITTLGTPTGTTLTPNPTEPNDQAAASTCVGNVTASEPTYTANTQHGRQGFASLGGWQHAPVPEERMVIPAGATVGLRLLTATFTSQDIDGEVVFREIG